jgi:septum formation protein
MPAFFPCSIRWNSASLDGNLGYMAQKWILASASPRRAQLLKELGVSFDIVRGQAEESHPDFLTPNEISQNNAHRKARCVGHKHPDALIIGADTIVCLGQQVFGKPGNIVEARQILAALSGQTHTVVTGVCLLEPRAHRQRSFAVTTAVKFHKLSIDTIKAYLAKVNPLDKAGAYGIQEEGGMIIESISGSYSNVMGLPMERLREELRAWSD